MIIRKKATMNVVEAARRRIINIFSNKDTPIYLSMSGGKDSITIAHLVYSLIQEGKISAENLTVDFIDEEGMYDCVIDIVKDWRKKFMMVGAKFNWWCLQVKHFNALNQLETKETWVCWDEFEKDKWMRKKPPFAINSHPLMRDREMSYQEFLDVSQRGGITIVGVRAAESLMRLQYLSKQKGDYTNVHKIFPIYDWKDSDVWKYIQDENLDFPEAYMFMYQAGVNKKQLRISCLFAVDTLSSLISMNEYYPDLMERITRREPNAYLVSLYWDSEMFHRQSARRRQLEGSEPKKDYKKLTLNLLKDIDKNFEGRRTKEVAKAYRNLVALKGGAMEMKHWKKVYEALLSGDTKLRSYRAIITTIFSDQLNKVKSEEQ